MAALKASRKVAWKEPKRVATMAGQLDSSTVEMMAATMAERLARLTVGRSGYAMDDVWVVVLAVLKVAASVYN